MRLWISRYYALGRWNEKAAAKAAVTNNRILLLSNALTLMNSRQASINQAHELLASSKFNLLVKQLIIVTRALEKDL